MSANALIAWNPVYAARRGLPLTKIERYYILLVVYNYDNFPRHQSVKHIVADAAEGLLLANHIRFLLNKDGQPNHTGPWLEAKHHIYGFVSGVVGVYKQTTEKLYE